mmetsp:Transcript_37976/g.83268  ORF Transcript_37976/g.83268 Transcript_37976/m.83268 type:complete len:123 (-) Transcript_37976:182-550(-)
MRTRYASDCSQSGLLSPAPAPLPPAVAAYSSSAGSGRIKTRTLHCRLHRSQNPNTTIDGTTGKRLKRGVCGLDMIFDPGLYGGTEPAMRSVSIGGRRKVGLWHLSNFPSHHQCPLEFSRPNP